MAKKKRKHSLKKIFGALWFVLRETFYYTRATLRFVWDLPPWAKQFAVLVGIAWFVFFWVPDWWKFHKEYERIYDSYYEYYYKEYSKTVMPDEANRLANYYADFYADYYTSKEYREALAKGLPSSQDKSAATYDSKARNAGHVLTKIGIDLIKHFEGYRSEPYLDAGGKLTIGYGHLIRQGEMFVNPTREEMEKLLREDVKVAEAFVKRYVKVALTPNQFAALVSLVYNIGGGAFKESTLLQHLNKGDVRVAANQFMVWDKVDGESLKGLKRRRAMERALFLR